MSASQKKKARNSKAEGKQIAALQDRIHSLKVTNAQRIQQQATPVSKRPVIPRNMLKRLVDHIPLDYMPQSALSPIESLRGKISECGLQWALEVLDPCGVPFTNPGAPDLTTGTRHVRTVRFGDTIGPPPGIGNADSGATWDLMFVTTPFIEFPVISFKKLATDSWPDFTTPGGVLGFVRNILGNSGAIRINDPASAGGSVWGPDDWTIGRDAEVAVNNGCATEYSAIRQLSRGLTTELVGPTIFKGGRVYSGQFAPNFIQAPYATTIRNLDGSVTTVSGKQFVWLMPNLSIDNVIASDPLYQERDAEEGDYLVSRTHLTGGICPFVPTADTAWMCFGSELGWSKSPPSDSYAVNTMITADTVRPQLQAVPVIGLNIGVVIYAGLNSSQSVRMKYKGSVEGIPTMGGPYANLAKVAPPSDPAAIQLVSDIVNNLPHSYPASYNDLGGLMGILGSILKEAGMPILKGLGNAGIPVLSPALAILHGIGQSVFGM